MEVGGGGGGGGEEGRGGGLEGVRMKSGGKRIW